MFSRFTLFILNPVWSPTVSQPPFVLRTWRRLEHAPCGSWLFTRMVCWKAPYFGSISPQITRLEPGLCAGYIQRRRRITNHLGTIHAIALCNLAELTAGLMTDVSIPGDMRWIPRGMQVRFLKKATGKVMAQARPTQAFRSSPEGYDANVQVVVTNEQDEPVFDAQIAMWVSPLSKRQP
jgi:acyl-coenzyme A thioesterase PaaI-like protein